MSINPPTKDKEEIINNQDNKTPPQNYEQNKTHKIQPPLSSSKTNQNISKLDFKKTLPDWINKPWMYIHPTHQIQQNSWLEEWSNVILSYIKHKSNHSVDISILKQEFPFQNQTISKNLTINDLTSIFDYMVSKNQAIWIGDNKNSIYIRIKSNTQYASEMHRYMIDNGYALDVLTLYDIQTLNQIWSNLPEEELKSVLNILVSQNKAEWIGKKQDTIKFSI